MSVMETIPATETSHVPHHCQSHTRAMGRGGRGLRGTGQQVGGGRGSDARLTSITIQKHAAVEHWHCNGLCHPEPAVWNISSISKTKAKIKHTQLSSLWTLATSLVAFLGSLLQLPRAAAAIWLCYCRFTCASREAKAGKPHPACNQRWSREERGRKDGRKTWRKTCVCWGTRPAGGRRKGHPLQLPEVMEAGSELQLQGCAPTLPQHRLLGHLQGTQCNSSLISCWLINDSLMSPGWDGGPTGSAVSVKPAALSLCRMYKETQESSTITDTGFSQLSTFIWQYKSLIRFIFV